MVYNRPIGGQSSLLLFLYMESNIQYLFISCYEKATYLASCFLLDVFFAFSSSLKKAAVSFS
jgi:hypothetical protein